VQAEEAVHETSSRKANCAFPGIGTRWMRHLRPFHRSASVPWPVWPTAMQDDRDGQSTAIKKLCCEPAGLGVGWIVHLRPSHRSASVTSLPEAPTASPTAVHADGAVQATPLSTLTRAPAGFGVR
jgi:hypothetical protein